MTFFECKDLKKDATKWINMDEYGSKMLTTCIPNQPTQRAACHKKTIASPTLVAKELDPCKAFSGESEEDPEADGWK